MSKKIFLHFLEARKFVHNLCLKNCREWTKYCLSGLKPDNIPSDPRVFYKNKGWISNGDWLGTRKVADKLKEFKSFIEAREFVHKLNLKGCREWKKYRSSGLRPDNIPSNPEKIYKNKGWISWNDFLRISTIHNYNRKFILLKEAREFVHKLSLKSQRKWTEYCNSGLKPDNIPSHPERVYKIKGWISWGDWLGTNNISTSNRDILNFKEARKFVRKLGLGSKKEFIEYCNSGLKPDNIPSNPDKVYINKIF